MLSDQEKMDALFQQGPLGDRRPSHLLASMLSVCPSGMEVQLVFQYFFLQRLPQTLRTLLGEQECSDIRAQAELVDRLWASHKPQPHEVMAVQEPVGGGEHAAGGRSLAQEEAVQEKDPWRRRRGIQRQRQHSLPCRAGSGGIRPILQALLLRSCCQGLHQALQLVGKLELPEWLNAVAPGLLVYINDQLIGRRFLVDTGAAFSILPHQSSKPAAGQGLVGPNGSDIRCWGESAVKLQLACQYFTWYFLLADVSMAISGIDFLRTHNLIVDPANCRLVQAGGRVFPNHCGDERPHSLSHHRSITAELEASLGSGRCKTALRVVSCRLECWQRGLIFHTCSCYP